MNNLGRLVVVVAGSGIASGVATYPAVSEAGHRSVASSKCQIVSYRLSNGPLQTEAPIGCAPGGTTSAGYLKVDETSQGALSFADPDAGDSDLEVACPIVEDDRIDLTTGTHTATVYVYANGHSGTTNYDVIAVACVTWHTGYGGTCGIRGGVHVSGGGYTSFTVPTSVWSSASGKCYNPPSCSQTFYPSPQDGFYVLVDMAPQASGGGLPNQLLSITWS